MSKRKKRQRKVAPETSHYPPVVYPTLTPEQRSQRAALKKAKKRVEQSVTPKARYQGLSESEKKALKEKQRKLDQFRKERALAALEVTHYSHQKEKVRFIKHK
ncbi:hypothetical protein [Leuconostoc citreum]